MQQVLLVGLGGFVGSILRYLISSWVPSLIDTIALPIGTIVVNIVGCFILGFLSSRADTLPGFSETTQVFLMVGILGGFTTFSTFGNETAVLLRNGQSLHALANILLQVVPGIASAWFGYVLGRQTFL